VPVVGAHERVDAHVVAGRLVGEERRDVRAVELGGAVQRHVRPHRLHGAAQAGAPEQAVRLLEQVAVLGVPPDHQVGVGAQAREVVGAADRDVLGGELVEQLLDLVRVTGTVLGQHVLQLEDGPQGVADDLVEVPGQLALVRDPVGGGGGGVVTHTAHSPAPAWRLCTGAAVRSRTSCGSPRIWSAAVCALVLQAGLRTAWEAAARTARAGRAARCSRTRATRAWWPTGYWGRPSSHRVTRVATGSASRPVAAFRSRRDTSTRSASSRRRISVSPCRPTEVRTTATSGFPAAIQPHFCEAKVAALMVRPSTGGTRKPLPSGRSAASRRKARVIRAMEAYSTPASSAAAAGASPRSSRAAAGAGTATTTAS